MSASLEPRRLTADDIPDTAAALARAFHDDPLQRYVLPDPEERATKSPAHFTPLLNYGLLFGEVWTTSGAPQGAALWLGPDAWEVTPDRAAAAGFDAWPDLLGPEATERFTAILAAVEPFHHSDVPPAHWYLLVLGLDPLAQGRGWARALMRPVMERADREGLPCYLETSQPRNVGLYHYLGFRTLVDMVDEASGLRLWTFRRDPPSVQRAERSEP